MPLYAYRCPVCASKREVFKSLSQLDRPELCECSSQMQRQVSAPFVIGDYQGYNCPITGKWVEGRKAHMENLKRHGCRVYEPGEREQFENRRKREEADFEKRVDETVEKAVEAMDTRKREKLASEMDAGVTAELVRS